MSRFSAVLRPPRKLQFTRDGRWFVTMTVLIGMGAVNTGNNLLYLLLGMMLGLIIVSGILSERVLRRLDVRRLPTGDLFARRESRMSWEVSNGKRLLSSFSIIVGEHESRETRRLRRVHLGLTPDPPRRRKDREAEDDPGGPSGLALRVPPGRSVVATGYYTFPRRGLYRFAGLDVGTRFPFGFFEKSRPVREPHEVLVYPEIRPEAAASRVLDTRIGERERPTEGRSGDFFGLREFRDGDDRRDVHWKASARREQLVRRTYEKQDSEAIALHLYDWAPPGEDPAAIEAVEEAIVAVASTCAALANDGVRFSLHTIGAVVPEGTGPGQLQTALRHLALIEIHRDADPPALVRSSARNRVLFAPPHAPAIATAGFEDIVQHVAAPTNALEEAA